MTTKFLKLTQISLLAIAVASAPAFAKQEKDLFISPPKADEITTKTVEKHFKVADFDKGLKQHNRILIGNYRVAYHVAKSSYVVEQGDTTTQDMGGGWQQVTTYKDQNLRASAFLKGVDSANLNAITEKAYQDLIQRLKAVGREVVTMDQIKDSAVIAKELKLANLDANGEYWTNFGIGSARTMTIVTWPDNTPLWFMFGDPLDVGAGLKAAGNALAMKNFGFIKQISSEQDAAMLDISVTVRFADTWGLPSKTLRKAEVGVVPTMRMNLEKLGVSSGKKTPFGSVPGPGGVVYLQKDVPGYNLGSSWAEYKTNLETTDTWSTVGQTIELEVTTTPENMEQAVMEGLTALNAAIAALAEKHSAK